MTRTRELHAAAIALLTFSSAPAFAKVATAAYQRTDSYQSVSTYRTMQDAAGRYTAPTDDSVANHATVQFVNCVASPSNCSGSTGGTIPGSPNDLTAAQSQATLIVDPAGTGNPTVARTATAAANLADGTLRGTSASTAQVCGFVLCGIDGQSFARLDDLLTFTVAGADANTLTDITVSFVVDGGFDFSAASPAYGFGAITDVLGFGNAQAILDYQVYGNTALNPYVRQIANGWKSFSWSGQDPSYTVFTGVYTLSGAGGTMPIAAYLKTEAGGGTATNYGSTSRLSLLLPANVRFTSDSGVFLTAQAGAVPEPSIWMTLILGFGTIGAALRRTRRGQAPAALTRF